MAQPCGATGRRRHGLRILTVEPDTATLQAMGLSMMSARRVDKIEDHACQHARRRLLAGAATLDGSAGPPA